MKKNIPAMTILLVLFMVNQVYAGLSFLKTVTFTNAKDEKHVFQQQRFYADGDMVRVEEEASDIEGNPKVRIYDFKKKKMYTIMMNVKLYLEQDISFEKDIILFEFPIEKKYGERKNIKIEKTKQGEETAEGHHLIKYELKATLKDEKGKDQRVLEQYNLWVAEDLDEMPVRYEFEENNGKRIISYSDIKTGTIDPSLFSIPEGYKSITPF
ncbi:MAG: hypothetical protein PH343_06005 [Nitrospira sp.]|nr:hypothetical protein [Nitrospira sp.]